MKNNHSGKKEARAAKNKSHEGARPMTQAEARAAWAYIIRRIQTETDCAIFGAVNTNGMRRGKEE